MMFILAPSRAKMRCPPFVIKKASMLACDDMDYVRRFRAEDVEAWRKKAGGYLHMCVRIVAPAAPQLTDDQQSIVVGSLL